MLTARAPGGSRDVPHNQIFPKPTKLKKIHIRKRACLDLLGEKIKQVVKSDESIVAYSHGCIQSPSLSASAGYASSVRMHLLNSSALTSSGLPQKSYLLLPPSEVCLCASHSLLSAGTRQAFQNHAPASRKSGVQPSRQKEASQGLQCFLRQF